jgi:broad specificity phosphatase PhoE
MELHLIRHGQSNWNEEKRIQGQSESILTDLGIQQAQVVGERLRHLDFDQVFCSTSLRTRQTAEHLFKHRDFDIEYLDSLREIGLGPWVGRLHDDVAEAEPVIYKQFSHEPHLFKISGAETFDELQQRIVTAVKDIVARFHQRQVVMVSHGTILKSFLCYIQHRPLSEMQELPQLHNCAHSIVEVNADGSGRVVQYADQPVD